MLSRSSPAQIITAVLLLVGLFLTSLYSYLLFHTLAEMFSIVIAYGIFVLGWNTRHYVRNNYLLFLSIAYLFIATLDLLHTLSYKGMNIFTDYDYYANQLWIATRYLESMTLLVAFLFLDDRRNFNPRIALISYTVITGLIIASIFYWKIFPVCFIDGVGLTPFKKVSEYIISGILIADIILLRHYRDAFHPSVCRRLIWAFIFTILSEIAFTFYVSNYGFSNLVGHYFKIFSFWLIYKAILETGLSEPFDLIFKELKETEEALLISRQRLKLALEVVSDGLWDWRADTGETFFSDQFYTMIGYAPGEFEQNFEAYRRLVHPDDLPEFDRAIQEDLGKGKLLNIEFRILSRDSGWHWILSRGRAVEHDPSDTPTRFVGTHMDITERKELEHLKDDVDRIMRHDLKAPLSGILGLPQILEMEENLTDEQRELLRQIEKAGRKMQNMIDMSLDLFKMETSRYEVHLHMFDVCYALNGLTEDYRYLKSTKNLRLDILMDGVPLEKKDSSFICGELRLLQNMLSNLLANAMEASPQGETVFVDYFPGDPARIEIRNKGAVPPEVRKNFFDKYATADKKGGTGLGTYSAMLMAKAQGWDLTMETSDQEGTTLTVSIPAREPCGDTED